MLIGPVFTREAVIAPRRPRTYMARVAYGLALLVLMSTAWLVLTGTQMVRDVGDLARFGMSLFQLLAPLQLALATFFAALLAASAVSQEKDRQTLILLLLTKLTNSELVLGKLLASLLHVFMLLATGLPLFMLAALFGGISFSQIGRVYAVTLASVLLCGTIGSTLALWREKTYQALATTMLVLVLWLAVGRTVATGLFGAAWWGIPCENWAVAFSPWEAVLDATQPYLEMNPAFGLMGAPVYCFLVVAVGLAAILNGFSVALVRVWNPSRQAHTFRREDETWRRASIWGAEYDIAQEAKEAAPSPAQTAADPSSGNASRQTVPSRQVWDNPVIWREICTWAYGRKILVVRLAYLVLFGLAAGSLWWLAASGQPISRASGVTVLAPLFLLSLVLINAQAVTALTSERDARALDLLLVSDLTPKEVVFGKLGGVLYNTKEMVLLPMLLCVYLACVGSLTVENMVYLVGGLAVLDAFVAVLGIHAGMNYDNSRSAIATSLGTVFFLFQIGRAHV